MNIKINWKVRLRQPAFWIATVPVVITFVYSVLALLGVAPSITQDTVQNLFVAAVSVLAQLGIIVDPTTKGISDSKRAMSYDKPD
ncbi:MAG: phage holin [Clostridia bacterium]|nr:phage holin [Clostridia bacterium]